MWFSYKICAAFSKLWICLKDRQSLVFIFLFLIFYAVLFPANPSWKCSPKEIFEFLCYSTHFMYSNRLFTTQKIVIQCKWILANVKYTRNYDEVQNAISFLSTGDSDLSEDCSERLINILSTKSSNLNLSSANEKADDSFCTHQLHVSFWDNWSLLCTVNSLQRVSISKWSFTCNPTSTTFLFRSSKSQKNYHQKSWAILNFLAIFMLKNKR